jgi:hypothetical protein
MFSILNGNKHTTEQKSNHDISNESTELEEFDHNMCILLHILHMDDVHWMSNILLRHFWARYSMSGIALCHVN